MISEQCDSKPGGLCYTATYNWYEGSALLNGVWKSRTEQNCPRPWKQGRASERQACDQKLETGEAGVRGHALTKAAAETASARQQRAQRLEPQSRGISGAVCV